MFAAEVEALAEQVFGLVAALVDGPDRLAALRLHAFERAKSMFNADDAAQFWDAYYDKMVHTARWRRDQHPRQQALILQGGTSFGKASWWFGYQLFGGLTNIVVYFASAPFGLRTMLVAFIVKTYLLWPIPVAMTMRLLGLGLGQYLRPCLPPLAAAASVYGAVRVIDCVCLGLPPWERLAVDVLSGLIVYGGPLALLAPETLRTFVRSLHRVRQVRHA